MSYTGISDQETHRQTPGTQIEPAIRRSSVSCKPPSSADPLIIYIVRSRVDRGLASDWLLSLSPALLLADASPATNQIVVECIRII